MTGATSLAEVLDLYEEWGQHPYDEEVSQLAHALQTAALAEAAGADDALVGASFLHDVGHLLVLRDTRRDGAPSADDHHEEYGAAWLRPLFGPTVTAPIVLHVRAKRYLCATDPTYVARLSEGSRRSLDRQGGPLTSPACATFEATAGFRDAVRLRQWDDAGKVNGLTAPTLPYFESLLEGLSFAL